MEMALLIPLAPFIMVIGIVWITAHYKHLNKTAGTITDDQAMELTQMSKIADILLKVVSEKTGYPAEMLELSMDMEADLGIDSIKRVEIFGVMTNNYPEVSGVDPQALAELRTLGEIVDYLAGKKKVLN